jgi:hypothetical protein
MHLDILLICDMMVSVVVASATFPRTPSKGLHMSSRTMDGRLRTIKTQGPAMWAAPPAGSAVVDPGSVRTPEEIAEIATAVRRRTYDANGKLQTAIGRAVSAEIDHLLAEMDRNRLDLGHPS